LGAVAKTCFPSRSIQKCFTATLGVNTKIFLIGSIQQINALSSCFYLSKVLLQKRSRGYAKVIHKKRRKEKRSVRDIENNGYLNACLKKKMKRR
jgi:hypothetical protein